MTPSTVADIGGLNNLTVALIVGFCLVVVFMLTPQCGRLWERVVLWFKSQ